MKMADGSQSIEPKNAAPTLEAVRERIDGILDGVTIPPNPLCTKGDSFDTLQNAGSLMALLAAIDTAQFEGCEFTMPDSGPYLMITLREMVQHAVQYAAKANDLELTLRSHADLGRLEKFIADNELDKLDLASMAQTAEKLNMPLWVMMIPDLAKHRELLEPGALESLKAIVETYLESTPSRRADIEQTLANAHLARIDEAMFLSKAAGMADRQAAQEVAHV
jgi:hypothetical protein